jgi:hypothetical protein
MKLDRQATSISGRNEAVPAGAGATTGLDPGYRTGVKVAVVTGTGQVAATTTIYPHEPQRRWDEAIAQLARLAREHQVELIAIGNGTASRETDRLGAEFIRLHPELELTEVVVSEGPFEAFRGPAGTRGSQQRPFKAFRGPPQLAGPQLGEPPAPTVWGKLKWYNPGKRYGFVEFTDGSGDAFLHASAIEGMSTIDIGELQ